MGRRWIGGVFGNTISSTIASNNASGVFSMGQQYYIKQEGGWIPVALGNAGNPASSAEQLRLAGTTTNGIYYINTPDGGLQQVYCMFSSGSDQGGDYGWMLIGRYATQAGTTVTNTLSSVTGLTDTSQNGTSYWSADFGTFTPTEVRMFGSTNMTDPMSNRTIDWIYGIPNAGATNLIKWISGDNTDYTSTSQVAFGNVSSGPKQGMNCSNARDGRGRWTNASYTYHRVADPSASNVYIPNGFRSPTSNMWYYHSSGDAKWSVIHTGDNSGQDTSSTSLFGYDDNQGPAMYDSYPSTTAQDSSNNAIPSAVFVFVR